MSWTKLAEQSLNNISPISIHERTVKLNFTLLWILSYEKNICS